MEKKSLNKKLQLNKETIAILDKEQQFQILGGDLPVTKDIRCNTGTTDTITIEPVTMENTCMYTEANCLTRSPKDCPSNVVGCNSVTCYTNPDICL
ncbi:MAG TPA: hypothetical protein DD434_13125 [Bacteroidales bacterium]|nr:hypothetical protein [Bacteroidales bacterium]